MTDPATGRRPAGGGTPGEMAARFLRAVAVAQTGRLVAGTGPHAIP